MTFPKRYMTTSELIKEGFPECILVRVWNTPEQEIAVKANPLKRNSKIIYDTKLLNKFLQEETQRGQALRGLI